MKLVIRNIATGELFRSLTYTGVIRYGNLEECLILNSSRSVGSLITKIRKRYNQHIRNMRTTEVINLLHHSSIEAMVLVHQHINAERNQVLELVERWKNEHEICSIELGFSIHNTIPLINIQTFGRAIDQRLGIQ